MTAAMPSAAARARVAEWAAKNRLSVCWVPCSEPVFSLDGRPTTFGVILARFRRDFRGRHGRAELELALAGWIARRMSGKAVQS